MNVLKTVFCFLIFFSTNLSFANGCDVAKTARQMVKAIFAIEDTKGVVSIYGAVTDVTQDSSIVIIEPHYQSTKDVYEFIIRNNDCRILQSKMIKENAVL